MATIIYKTGDLLDGPERVIIHGCNAQGVMGSGVARQIREKFPTAFREYREIYEREGLQLGSIHIVDCGEKIVVNAITQERYGRSPNTVYVSYDAIRSCIRKLNEAIRDQVLSETDVAMPLIGAGLGGGKWSVISKIIEEESTTFTPVVYFLPGMSIPD